MTATTSEPGTPVDAGGAGAQTLSRGLRAIEILAEAPGPLSIAALARALDVHRSSAYRVLRSLEAHRFVVRDDAGLIRLGPKLTALARGVAPSLTSAAQHPLAELAETVGMTAFITVLDADEVITLASAEPASVPATISRSPGVRHPIDRGAPGHAIESGLTPDVHERLFGSPDPTPAAAAAQRSGYSLTEGEVIDGVVSIAVPLTIAGEPPAAVAVVHFSTPDNVASVVADLHRTADRIARNYR